MAQSDFQEQQLAFLIWFARKRIHEIFSRLGTANRSEIEDLTDLLKSILETVTLAEYSDDPIDVKLRDLLDLKQFLQTLGGTDIHGRIKGNAAD